MDLLVCIFSLQIPWTPKIYCVQGCVCVCTKCARRGAPLSVNMYIGWTDTARTAPNKGVYVECGVEEQSHRAAKNCVNKNNIYIIHKRATTQTLHTQYSPVLWYAPLDYIWESVWQEGSVCLFVFGITYQLNIIIRIDFIKLLLLHHIAMMMIVSAIRGLFHIYSIVHIYWEYLYCGNMYARERESVGFYFELILVVLFQDQIEEYIWSKTSCAAI